MTARKTNQRRNAKMRKAQRRLDSELEACDGKAETITLGFQVDNAFVYLIVENKTGRIPLFPAGRLNRRDIAGSLRNAIATLMQDE